MTTDNAMRYTAHVIERGADLTNNRQRGNRGKAAPEVRPGIAEQSAEDETGREPGLPVTPVLMSPQHREA